MNNRIKLPLFDDYWIDFRKGTVRRWFEPELFATWRDTDFDANSYCQLICDREAGTYRFYYEASPNIGNDDVRYLAAAETTDFQKFTPVHANDRPEERMRRVVLPEGYTVHGSSVMLDPYDPDPARRYKYAGMVRKDGQKFPPGEEPVILGFSPDGLRWELHPELVAHPFTSDAYNQLFYNPYTEEYGLLHRAAVVDRRVALRTSRDLKTWSEPKILLHPGPNFNDNMIEMQFYSMGAYYLDGIFLGVLWRFNTNLSDMDFSKMWGFMESELVYSYDGEQFLYTTGRPVAQRPLPPSYGCAQMDLCSICESLDGKEYLLAGCGSRVIHGTQESNRALSQKLQGNGFGSVFLRIRKDGFCGIEGPGLGSCVITKPLELLKDDLTFNLRANCGYARFGIMKKDGTFLDGFSYDDCVPLEMDDSVELRPQWKGHQLSEVLGQQVRIAVELNGAILHSIAMTARPYIVLPQKSFINPLQVRSE